MNRLAMGAALGGLAVYLYDPELGEERRERLFSLWQENRGSAVQAGRAVSQAAESARPLARRMTKAVGRREWAEAFDRGRPPIGLTKLIGAAVIGGTLVYFLDPVEGAERRQRLLSAVKAVTPHADRVSDQVADAVEGVRSKVR